MHVSADRERLKNPRNGVKYFKSYLRPLFVKGAANVFLYRFQQAMNLHRGDMLRWMTRFQLSLTRLQESWNDTCIPITNPAGPEVAAFIAVLPQEEQQTITPEDAMARANARLLQLTRKSIPLNANYGSSVCQLGRPDARSKASVDIIDGASQWSID